MDNAEQCHIVHLGDERNRILVVTAHEPRFSGVFFSVS